jgi:diacylglycerol kinase family enzyme/membrane-associated phospholipid phosphatase
VILPVAHRLRAADRRLFAAAASRPSPRLDRVIPRLTSAADRSVLWLGTAAVLAATGERGRRAALRGVVSLSVASAVANGPAKWLVRRPRPGLDDVPLIRQLRAQPRTTSFPSGHSASAAAFATGVAIESTALALPVTAAAAGVAYGRVHTGVHYPGDVLAGVALGVGCALLVRRSWPPRRERTQPATAPAVDAPAAPDGAGLVVVVNAAAASIADIATRLRDEIHRKLPRAEVVLCDADGSIDDALADAAARARILGVAGGDGTVNCAAGIAMRAGLPLAVFPAGTLNHFAGELGLDDVDDVVRSVAEGTAVEVRVATAGDGLHFLNTFSIGLYPELVRRRESRERVLGKWPALVVALVEVLGRADPTDLEVDGRHRRVWLLFGGNGRYQPPGFAPSWRERLDEGVVDVRIVDADEPFARTRLVAAVLGGGLARCRVYQESVVRRMSVTVLDRKPELARDGESEPAPRDLVLTADERPLTVYRPEPR